MSSLLLSLFALALAAEPAAQVRSFSPTGNAKDVRQVRVEFTRPIVRFGTARAPAPIEGECLTGGEGRWIDSTNWVFDFKDGLSGGHRCSFRLRPDLRDVAGAIVSGQTEFSFNTGGPAIVRTFPETWNAIDEEQAFVLVTDAEVEPSTVEKLAFVSVQGIGDRIPLNVVSGSEEERILRAAREANRWDMRELVKIENGRIVKTKPMIVVRADRRFPFEAQVALQWPVGLRSKSGAEVHDAQTIEWKVREDFVATFGCQREGAGKPCIPSLPMTISFTRGVRVDAMKDSFVESKDGKRFKVELSGRPGDEASTFFEFKGPFAPETEYRVHLPAGVADPDGRKLSNASKFPLAASTGRNPPLLKFAADFGVIESSPSAMLPVTVRDVEARIPMTLERKIFPLKGRVLKVGAASFAEAIRTLNAVKEDPYGSSRLAAAKGAPKKIELRKPHGEKEFEVVGIPLPSPGFYFVELESPRLGDSLIPDEATAAPKTPRKVFYVRSTALVTGMAVHLKSTAREAFVWVTSLEESRPVAGADVRLLTCDGKPLASGRTAADGTARLVSPANLREVKCGEGRTEFYAVAAKDGDFTFTSSEWDRGIETWRYRVNTDVTEPVRAHTILDRNLLRPTETVSMKHVLRRGTKEGFGLLKPSEFPKKAVIEHESGLQKFELPLKWNAALGTAESAWKIPDGAKLGRWQVRLEGGKEAIETSGFRVENYKAPLLRGQLKLPDEDLVAPESVPVQIGVEYLAGGGAGPLDVKTRWSIEDGTFTADDDELNEFAYLNGGVREGVTRSEDGEDDADGATTGRALKGGGALKLDANGTGDFAIGPIRPDAKMRVLRVEAEYRDANGEIQTAGARANLWPNDRIVGIKSQGWQGTKKRAAFDVVVVDLKGRPVEGLPVEVELYKSDSVSHRKRLIGGFYGYESYTRVRKLGRLCADETDRRGRLVCAGPVAESGSVRAVARIRDRQGRLSEANTSLWIVDGEEQLWFGSSDADRADLIPSRKRYEPGETAEFRLEAPFRKAKVLLTIEREGVIEHKVVDWDSSRPTVSLPVKASWAPNVFVTALALRGRVGDVKPTALLDLGKPAFKMGIAEIRVGWKKHELKVKVSTDAKAYRVRSKAKAAIEVVDFAGKPVRGEVSVAVVDEGLLQLSPNPTWNLLERMMDPRPLLVRTATGQSQVIGKRHFGLKAVAAGGDGGRALARELFDTLLLWKGTVKLDARGRASVEIPVNDSLTSFRVVAIALNGRDRFGTGSATFRTTQELMIFSGAPSFAREGDRVAYVATVRNTGTAARRLDVSLRTDPPMSTPPKRIALEPGHVVDLSWNLDVPAGVTSVRAELSVREDGRELDRLKTSIEVVPVWKPTVRQSTLAAVDKTVEIPIEPATGAVPGTSKIRIEPVAGLASGRAGLDLFWRNYEYSCLEQRISRAVGTNDAGLWRSIESDLDRYLDEAGRLRYFPGPGDGSLSLNAYALSVAKEAGFRFSAEREKKLLGALAAFAENKDPGRDVFPFPDRTIRRISAMDALSRYGRFAPAMLSFVRVTPNLWPTSTVVEWLGLVRREKNLADREKRRTEAESIVRSRMTFTGGKFAFSDEKTDAMWWLMRDSTRPTTSLILTVADDPAWKGDLPRILRGLIEKQAGGSWGTTTANAWGRLALDRYKAAFEKDPVRGKLTAAIGAAVKSWDWSKGPRGELTFDGPAGKTALMLKQEGAGKPYAFVRAIAAVPLTAPVSSGYSIERRVEAVSRAKPDRWTRGDVVKVVLKIRSAADAGWVAVEEPLPPGGIALGSGFGNESVLMRENQNPNALWSAFEERGRRSLRSYFAWVPAGEHVVEYRIRYNQAGTFQLPATRLEAMYDPDVFAEVPNAVLEVRPE